MSFNSIQPTFSPRAAMRAELNNIDITHPPVPLLAWWRELPMAAMGAAHDLAIRRTLGNVTLSGQPRWRDAVNGDAAACIGLALPLLPMSEPATRTDLIMSALLRCAIAGNAAATLVLSHARESYRRCSTFQSDTCAGQVQTHSVLVANGGRHRSSPIVATAGHRGSSAPTGTRS
jgi:hypothetical protein